MTLRLKPGVRLHGIEPQMILAMHIAEQCCAELGTDCTVTSAVEAKHGAKSLHYVGRAIDIRTRTLTPERQETLRERIASRLGTDFDVLREATHIHIEWDPKGMLNG